MTLLNTQTISKQNYTIAELETDFTTTDIPKRLSSWHLNASTLGRGFCEVVNITTYIPVLKSYGTYVNLASITKEQNTITATYTGVIAETSPVTDTVSLEFKFHENYLINDISGSSYAIDILGHTDTDEVLVDSDATNGKKIGFSDLVTTGDDTVRTVKWYTLAGIEDETTTNRVKNLSSWLLKHICTIYNVSTDYWAYFDADSISILHGEENSTITYTFDNVQSSSLAMEVKLTFVRGQLTSDPSGGQDYATLKLALSGFEDTNKLAGGLQFSKDATV